MEAINKDTKEGEIFEKQAFESREEISATVYTVGSAIAPNQEPEKSMSPDETLEAMDWDTLEDDMRISGHSTNVSYKDTTPYRQLYIALSQNDWKEAEDFIEKFPEALTSFISENPKTLFHNIAVSKEDRAIRLLKKCLRKIPPESLESVLEKEDTYGSTALFSAASVGNIKVTKLLVERNSNLVTKRNKKNLLPLHHAAFSGHKETIKYLLNETKKSNGDLNHFTGDSGYRLVMTLIKRNLYDIAFDLLKEYPKLARDELHRRRGILEMLARKPMEFESGSRLGYWQRLIYHYIPVQEECIHDYPHIKQKNDMENPIQKSPNSSTKLSLFRFFGAWSQKLNIMLWKILLCRARSIQAIYDKKFMHISSVEMVKMMCAGVLWSIQQAEDALRGPIHIATRMGIPEIVKEIIKAYPDILDVEGNNVLRLAILHRQDKVFKLISQFDVGRKFKDEDHNNILHLVAKWVPARQIPGAALQMQWELQWFKAVENYVPKFLQEESNCFHKTPRMMFTEEHEKLIEKGEKWMKNNASSCTIAVSLIITAVFAAAFTVPGDYNDDGIPNFLHKLAFKMFVISDGLALFSSTTSLLIFLGILTASYSEEDFLFSLPRQLIFGFITMFISIASMMVAYGATIYMVFPNHLKWVIIPLGCIPVIIFVMLQYPLLLRTYNSTYAPTISQPIKNM